MSEKNRFSEKGDGGITPTDHVGRNGQSPLARSRHDAVADFTTDEEAAEMGQDGPDLDHDGEALATSNEEVDEEALVWRDWQGNGKRGLHCFFAVSREDPDDVEFFMARRRHSWLRQGGLTPESFDEVPKGLSPILVNRRIIWIIGPNATNSVALHQRIDERIGASLVFRELLVLMWECFRAGSEYGESLSSIPPLDEPCEPAPTRVNKHLSVKRSSPKKKRAPRKARRHSAESPVKTAKPKRKKKSAMKPVGRRRSAQAQVPAEAGSHRVIRVRAVITIR